MKIPRALRYFTAMDVIDDASMREASVYFEHKLDPNNSLPAVDAGIEGSAEIYGIRAAALCKATGAIALRITGIDALARTINGTKFPH